MEPLASLLVTNVAAVFGAMFLLWLLSLALRDASIVDVWWGLGFVLVAGVGFATGSGAEPRRLLVLVLTGLWGLRLGVYLGWRNWGEGEDYRYVRMRQHHGRRFPWVSLVTVFGLQGAVMWIVSLPVQFAQASPEPAALGLLDALGAGLWLVGITFESVGDWQLTRFKGDPANAGQVLDRGLWGWTRHPNYFGDAVVWWGLGLIALSTPGGWLALVGPIVMTFFLLRVSGVAMLERNLKRTKPAYADYVARTPAFFPRPPRRA
ncbi:MAG: DUF1295 domain-containing protein [Proteobacteria bacterium]|nr:DUF1295 domain-containing protein [Pseudomonadota bacterium]